MPGVIVTPRDRDAIWDVFLPTVMKQMAIRGEINTRKELLNYQEDMGRRSDIAAGKFSTTKSKDEDTAAFTLGKDKTPYYHVPKVMGREDVDGVDMMTTRQGGRLLGASPHTQKAYAPPDEAAAIRLKQAGKTSSISSLGKMLLERDVIIKASPQGGADPLVKVYDNKINPAKNAYQRFVSARQQEKPGITDVEIDEKWEARELRVAEAKSVSKGEGFARSRPVRVYDNQEKRFVQTNQYLMDQANIDEPGRFTPASEAKYAIQEVKDMVISLREDMPTNDIKVMRQSVPSVLKLIGQARVGLTKTKVGPLVGRWKQAMTTKVGLADKDFKRLRVDLSLLATRLMKMHVGAQGSDYIMQHFKEIVEAGKDSPENLIVALDEIEEYAREVGMTHGEQRKEAGLDKKPNSPQDMIKAADALIEKHTRKQ